MRAYSVVRAGKNEGDEGRLGGGLIQPLFLPIGNESRTLKKQFCTAS